MGWGVLKCATGFRRLAASGTWEDFQSSWHAVVGRGAFILACLVAVIAWTWMICGVGDWSTVFVVTLLDTFVNVVRVLDSLSSNL